MLQTLGIALGGLALAIYGLWLLRKTGTLVDMERRRISRFGETPGMLRAWRVRHFESGQYRLNLQISGVGAVLMGSVIIAMMGRDAGLW